MYHYYKRSTHTVPMLLLLLLSHTGVLQFRAKAVALPSSSCPERCGDVKIVYPFGIGARCAMEGFNLECNKTKDGSTNVTFLGNIRLLNISLLMVRFEWNTASRPCATTSRAGVSPIGKGAWNSTTHHSHSWSCATGSLLSASTHWRTWLALLWVITSNFHLKMVTLWIMIYCYFAVCIFSSLVTWTR